MEVTSNNKETRQATWIWYPGDFEIWLGNRMNNRRTERGTFFPPFWKQDSHYVTVEFSTALNLSQADRVQVFAEGKYNVKLDGKLLFGMPREVDIPAGEHHLNIKVWNQATPPMLFVQGREVVTDGTWRVTNEDKEWIDESGKASDTSASVYMDAGSWNFRSPSEPPSHFALSQEPCRAVHSERTKDGVLYDFGRETFGYLVPEGVEGDGVLHVYYGESAEEAQDTEHCETLDKFAVQAQTVTDLSDNETLRLQDGAFVTPVGKAFRYILLRTEGDVKVRDVSMRYEYLPETARGTFKCNDDMVNKMWEIGQYTLRLTTREFFIDGIKRDRWTWSGDAYQSYLMNYYLFFDSQTVTRTIWQLRGKDPVTAHINTIMDYTFYWFLSIYDYYLYTGDLHFVQQIYPRMQSLMDYVVGRTDKNGMVEGMAGDWVFVDWSPVPMDKHGELSFEQILFARSLRIMKLCAELTHHDDEAKFYDQYATRLSKAIVPTFWSDEAGALIHAVGSGDKGKMVERYANIFAILFGFLTDGQKQTVARTVLHNPKVMPITTPYMRFYEMEALCLLGEQDDVLRQMKDYWGGMIAHGATSFWEAYDPALDHDGLAPLREHLCMYGRPYGKSLCHAWGASPIYLLGKYFLGVKPLKPGYKEFEVRPVLGGLEWMEGDVPTPHGTIHVAMNDHQITVRATEGEGYLYLRSKQKPECGTAEAEPLGDEQYRVRVRNGNDVVVAYNAVK